MATIDLTRNATNFQKHYAGVRMQQGRVLTDDDFNESTRLEAEDVRRTRLDVIGPSGSPDQGFLIDNPVIDATTGRPTFTIKAGTLYLGGQRLVLEADEPYHLQKDWLEQGAVAGDWLTAPAVPRFDLAYLETWQQAVSAVEDSELAEVALGGPDTSVRVRNLRRVRVLPGVSAGDCASAWAALLATLTAQGTLDAGSELVPDAPLKIEPDGTSGTADLCSPPVAGGYLGAENQAIRVQITGPGEFTWGFDNAAPLYRVQLGTDSSGQKRRITMLSEPKDQAHWPLIGQVVELLPWSAVLPNGQKISELHGDLAKVTASYNPDAKTFDIDVAPANDASGQAFGETWKTRNGPGGDAAALNNEGEFYYLRVWNRGSDTASPARIPFMAGTAVSLAHTGLKVTFSGTQLRLDDFWIIAVRPDSPNTFVPWDIGPDPANPAYPGRRPHGVRRWLTPLAVIRWPGGNAAGTVVSDCRNPFPPLTQIRNCCTVTVGDGSTSHGLFTSIQAAVDSLPAAGGRVCILSGNYQENIRILNRAHIILCGCGPSTVIKSNAPSGEFTSAAPVIYVAGGQDITIEALAVEADPTGAGIVIEGFNPYINGAQDAQDLVLGAVLAQLLVTGGTLSAASARFVRDLVIRDSVFRNLDATTLEHTVVVLADDALITGNVIEISARDDGGPVLASSASAARTLFSPGRNADGGLHIEGTSERVRVIDNLIRGGIGHGITLGTIIQLDGNGDPVPPDGGDGTTVDPCASRDPGDIFVVVQVIGTGEGQTKTGSLGVLRDILIERNRIYDMGLCGIGVIGFFDLSNADEFITVAGLTIIGNDISNNLWRNLTPIDPANINSMGYGGIALADVSNLVVRDNSITDNGFSAREPVCGIFVLHGEGIEISRNHITDGGRLYRYAEVFGTSEAAAAVSVGRRGGINVVYALPPVIPVDTRITTDAMEQSGVPAVKVHDNVVAITMGQSLSVMGVGPMSILGNQFTTRGVVRFGPSTTFWAANVAIVNLGLSDEIYLQLVAFALIAKGSLDLSSFSGALSQPGPGLDDAGVGRLLANGNVLFSENQCVLDLIQTGMSLAFSSIGIFSLDDIHFHGNQCDCNLLDDLILTHALLFGFSLRLNDNRFKEGVLNALFSAIALGLMASAVGNQSTHCLLVRGFVPALTLNNSNRVLMDALNNAFCKRYAGLATSFGK